jgi:hypothetical protein
MTPTEEDELYEMMKDLPDFESFPIPIRWFKKYNIPPRKATDTREFLKSNYTFKRMVETKDLPPLIRKEPLDGGRFPDIVIPEPEVLETVVKPYDKETTDMLSVD